MARKTSNKGRKSHPLRTPQGHLIALEPRMMFDGAAVDTAVATLQQAQIVEKLPMPEAVSLPEAFVEPRTQEDLAVRPGFTTMDRGFDRVPWRNEPDQRLVEAIAAPAASKSLIFIDTAVEDYLGLAREWEGQGEIILIDRSRDGIDQVMTALAGRSGIEAIHIVSHGGEGYFTLGTTRIDQSAVGGELAPALAAIGSKLTANGDIQIYGCDVGAGTAGQGLLDALAAKTGADVAASIDDTGSMLRGGDWILENRTGVVESATLLALDWQGLLAPAPLVGINGNLTVKDAAGANVAFAAGQSGLVGAGAVARWTNVSTINGVVVDLVATVASVANASGVRFNQPATNGTLNDDFGILLVSSAGTGNATAVVNWTLVRTGTNTLVNTDISFTVADIDGINATTRREFVVVSTDTLSSFESAGATRVKFDTSVAGQVTAFGTADESGSAESGAKFNWLNTSGFQITYNLNRANGAATQALFNHDGDLDFNLGAGGVTTSIPRLDLDLNDGTTSGSGYVGTFTENGSAVSIVDSDVTITNPVGTVATATVTFNNAQAGDELLVSGSLAASGTFTSGATTINYTRTASGVQFTGAASAAVYEAALKAVTFRNTTDTPNGTDRTFNISFSNGTFASNVAVSTIKVVEVNDTPTISAPGSYNGTEDTALTINGLNMADIDAGNGSVQLVVSVPAGVGVLNFAPTAFITVLNNGTGTVTLQGQRAAIQNAINGGALTLAPTANFNGTSTISFVFNDRGNTGIDPGLTGDGTSEEARTTATITIAAVNDAPTPVGTLPSRANLDGASGISVATASAFADVDGPSAIYSATGLPAGLSINSATGEITGTVNRSASQTNGGIYNVVVTRSDGSLSATQPFTWTITNPPPVATNDATLTVNEDTAGTTVNVLANDSDPDGDPLTITGATATNGTVTVNANGTLTFTPNANYNGPATITYTISDGEGGTATATVPVNVVAVNDAPTRVGTLPPQTNVDAAAGINVPTAQAFADIDGPTAIYSATGLPAGLSIDSATGAITGTIDRSASQGGAAGVYNVVVTRSDGSLSVTQPFTWTVTNPAPVAVNDGPLTTAEDTPIASINVRANDSDPDGDPINVVSASAVNGTVTINPDGTLRYVPNANYNGTDTITYTISDGQGGTSTATVAITITAVNDTPTPVGSLPPQTNVDAAGGINVATAQGFKDVEPGALTYSATGLPAGLSINATTGAITGTIGRSASQVNGGTYSVTVTATDAGGLSTTQTFNWTVTNPVPVASNDTATTAEDTPVTVNVLANDSDPDGDPLTVIAAVASVGTATVVGNQVQYTPPANFNGTATITYTISDGEGGTATATLTVTVTAVNDAPVGTPIPPRNTQDGAVIAIPVAPNFSDVDGDTLSFAATGLPPGLSINPATGLISGTIDKSASQANGGVYTATITVSDGKGGTTTQTITFNVTNPGPTANNDTASTPEDTPVTISPLANDTDPDGDLLTITSAQALNGSVVINPDGTVTYTPNPGFNGTDTITYEISDGNGGTSIAKITVSVADVNDTPTRNGTIANQTNLDSQVISLPVSGAFIDPDGDALSYTATGLPAGLTINPTTGVISGTIDNAASQVNGGVYSITVTASDGRGGSISQTFSWTVTNPAPGAVNDTATTNEDTAVRIPVLANDVDPDGDPLTVTQANAGNGTVTINPDGSLFYTPNPNFNGTDTIFYTISDGNGGVSTATVTVTVRPVNDAPTTVGLPNQNGDDGQTVSFSVASAFRDPDGDPLTFSATGLPPNLTIDPATGLITGTLAPETSVNGPYVVTITATDPSGAQVTTSFVYSVQNVPPVAVNDFATTPEDTPVRVAVLTNDSDPDGDPLTITSANANNGTVVINPDGTLTFTPNPNFNGIATVSYTVSDGQGGIATATLTIDVRPVNDAPTSLAIPPQASVDGAFYSANVAPFFSDIDGDTLTFSATGLPLGLSIDPATGNVSGTIDRNASQVNGGVYAVTITASDGKGGTVSRVVQATITNPAPTAVNDAATTNEDTPVSIPVLTNDTDPDGDPLIVTSATALNGTVTINADGTITYTPNANFNGTDTITYVISDGNGGRSTAAVTVTVNPVNDQPVAVNDNATTNEDTPVTLNPLANDTDVDGDSLNITAATSPNGTVVINPDGTITFTPAANFNGPTTITYTISDGKGGTSTATINILVDSVNDAPVANPSTATTNEDTSVTVPVLANDTDVDGDPLTVTAASAPNGTVVINPDGTVTYTPKPDFNGTDTITYTISDGKGGFSTSTVTVMVGAVNDAPVVATPIAPQANDDANVINLNVASNFSDTDGNPLSFTATGLPPGLSISAAGVITGTIDKAASQGGPNGDGTYSVTVTASDGNGGTVTSTFTWVVGNPGPTATNDLASTNEDAPVFIPVLSNDTDPDADPLTVISATAPNGTVVINPDGTITYTPKANFNGTDTITYTISDGNGGTSTAIVTVTVNPVNDGPVVDTALPAQTGVDSGTVSIPLAGNFSDLDGDTLTFTATGLPAGLSIGADGKITGTIDKSASQGGPNGDGIYTVSVTASDGKGGTVTTSFTYTVTNPGPTATNDSATTNEDTPVTIPVLANDTDPDGDPLTVISATSPNGTVVINADGSLTFTPAPNFNGPTTITYTVSDGNGGTSTATVAVTVVSVNDVPTADAPLPDLSGVDNTAASIPTAANFSDLDGDPLTFSATGLPLGLTIDPATGIISGTIDKNASQVNGGVYTITVTATDNKPGTIPAQLSFKYTVTNPAPVAQDDTATTNEDVPITIPVLTNDRDPDGDVLTVTSATAPNGTVVINANGTITYTPNANYFGTDTITYTISDGQGGTSTAKVTVTVNPVNDAPTADPPLTNQANLDSDLVSIDVSPSFADLDGDTLSFTAIGLPAGLSISAAGVITGTIDRAASQPNGGIYTVTVTASDGKGGTVNSTFTWKVTNPAPTAVNDTAATNEDTAVTIPVLTNDSDPDGDPLTVTAASAPNGTVVVNGNGTITYTPKANFFGTDTITYTISDGNGGFDTATVKVTVASVNDTPTGISLPDQFDIDNNVISVLVGPAFSDVDGDALSFSATGLPTGLSIDPVTGEIFGQIDPNASGPGGSTIYAVTITATDADGASVLITFNWTITNRGPLAQDDVATTAEETPVTISVLANDFDPDRDPVSVVSGTVVATNGTAILNANGTITFTPDSNFVGTATVNYRITDGNGGFSTATAVITVTPVNDAPVGLPLPNQNNLDADSVSVNVAPSFSDVDGDSLTFSATGLPAGLSIDPATGLITGTVDRGASQPNGGTYSVTITATDGAGATAVQTFTWQVTNPTSTATDDVATTDEDTPVVISPLTNDTDPDSDPLSITAASAANGTVVINADGTITYRPDTNFNGTDTINYTISDGNGGTSTAVIIVTVNPGNDAPTATPLPARANLDSTVVDLSVASSFADLDGDTLTFSATGLPGNLVMDGAGRITGTIDRDASKAIRDGIYTVTVTATDGNGGSFSSTFTWTITNPPPVAVNDPTVTIAEDPLAPVAIAVLTNDTDPDGDPLTVTTATASNGTVTIGAGGVLSYTPDKDFNGTDTIVYTISDGNGGTSIASVVINVTPVNDAPVAALVLPRSNVDGASVSIPFAGNFTDVDGAPPTFTATGLPAGLSIDPTTGVISGTIDKGASQVGGGVYTVTISADDRNGGVTPVTFTWTITNPPPIAVNDVASTLEDFPVNINVLGNDRDPDGDALTVTTASAGNGTVVIKPDGTIDYTPGPDFNGTDTITYTISDGNGGTATAIVTVTVGPVNDAPTPTPDTATTPEDTPVRIPVLANDSDKDGDPLTVTAATAPNGTVVINPDGTITYTPNPNFNGTDTITYTVSDGKGGFATSTVTVIVAPVNDAPVAVNDTASTPEDTPVTVNVLGNDRDVDGDPLTVIGANSPDGQVVINPDGTITFTPNPNFNGTTTATYTISDGNGGTSTATVTLTVSPVNDPPVANPSVATTNEDTPVNIPVLANDTDVDRDPLTVTAASAANGTVVINPDGTVRYTPNPNFNGTDTITYTISDGKGGTATSTVTVTVNAVNDVPVAGNDTATTPEDQPVTIPVLGNDRDADGDPLTITAATSPNGTVVINPDGTITFTPNPNFNGTATITYTVSDGKGGTATATATVTVTPVNDPPVANPSAVATDEDVPVRVPVLANDTDVDGDPLTVVRASADNGTVVINPDGMVTYTPNANFNGTDVITYQISDGKGGTSTSTATVTVRPVNDVPVARNDVFTMDENTTGRIPVLANDFDLDGDPLTVTAASSPEGRVTINPDGTISFTPNPDFFGTATITYTISDGKGGTSTATVAVTVRNTNSAPVDGDEAISTIGGVITPINVLGNARDLDGDRLSVFSAKVDVGTVTINPDGTLSYVAPAEFQGVATIVYIVSDGKGGFDRSIVTIIVTQANADVNALLGLKADPAIPDRWRVDEVRNQSEEFIEVPVIIDQMANDFRSLRPTPMLFGERPLLTAINGISSLRGITDLTDTNGPIGDMFDDLDRIRDIRFGADRLFDPRFGDFIVKSLTGFSVRQLNTGNEQLMIESVVRDRVIYMEIRDIGKDSDPRIVEYQLRARGGEALPDWIRMDSRGLAIIERPLDADTIRLIVRAIRADGKVIEIPVIVQGATGEIQIDEAVAKKQSTAEPLSKTMALATNSVADEAARLAAAFNGEG